MIAHYKQPQKRVVPVAIPTQDLKAESGVIGSMLHKPAICEEITSIITQDDFYSETRGILFRRLCELHKAGIGIDAITLTNCLEKHCELDKIGFDTICEILDDTPTATHATHYATQVREASITRQRKELSRALFCHTQLNQTYTADWFADC